jgi:hypothetical protein
VSQGTDTRSCWIEPLDLFGLGRMWWRDQPGRECLQDHARYDAFDRSQVVIEIGAPGTKGSRLEIEVAQDAAGRWWSGYMWRCWEMPDGTASGRSDPIDAHRGETRDAAIRAAATALLQHLPDVAPTSKAARIVTYWRRELPRLAGLPEASAAT